MIKEYSTNEMCKLCNVSRKQLVYYEDHGLLRNVLRKENNYRYYSEINVEEVLIIKELRRIGFSIEEISTLAMDNCVNRLHDTVKKRVENAKAELDRSVLRYEQSNEMYAQFMNAISLLKARNVVQDSPQNDYEIIEFPGQNVISRDFQGQFYDAGEHIAVLAEMDRIIDEYDITILGSVINIYYDHFDSVACTFDNAFHPVEICMTVADMKRPCPYYKKLEPCKVLATTHFGSFETDLDKTYIDLLSWAKEQGYRLSNTTIEEWLIGPLNTQYSENWVTRIMIPFRK